ncbi:MAG: LTA synthase family protein [Clostridiales bacterium]|nr:LTA synthase family protein [Clostridiales bacterium]
MTSKKKTKKTRRHSPVRIVVYVLVGLAYLLACTLVCVCDWSREYFNVSLEEILFTLTNPLEGADNNIVWDAVKYCLPRILLVTAAYVVAVWIDWRTNVSWIVCVKIKKFVLRLNVLKIARFVGAWGCIAAMTMSVFHVDKRYGLFEFIKNRMSVNTIYEEYYVNPKEAGIVLPAGQKKKNLVYIVLESMETTYADKEHGGAQSEEYIPNLLQIAKEYTSFSNGESLGGFYNTSGTMWTMGALMALTSGVPFDFPTQRNSMNKRESFAPGLTTIGEVLDSFGYTQEFLCGSNGEFGGRRLYFETHGGYEIYDLYSARADGYIPEGYYVFWGYEDLYLYEIAKDELTRLSQGNEPFNLTMLTVDTHAKGGYVCKLCKSDHAVSTANVVSCADRQLKNFLDWCKAQPFYEDTVIVVTGDHPRMDDILVAGVETRPIYNCFVNAPAIESERKQNRVFTPMDMFPTTLAAMGFSWQGNRLGLGTNLYSSQKTLSEELGFDYLDAELKKSSRYYEEHFY